MCMSGRAEVQQPWGAGRVEVFVKPRRYEDTARGAPRCLPARCPPEKTEELLEEGIIYLLKLNAVNKNGEGYLGVAQPRKGQFHAKVNVDGMTDGQQFVPGKLLHGCVIGDRAAIAIHSCVRTSEQERAAMRLCGRREGTLRGQVAVEAATFFWPLRGQKPLA
jgi:hypothetical protein